jgi:hypothetical protein
MKSKEWLFEAEQNVAKKKIDQQLDQLSDQEIDALLSMITTSLEEGRFDYDPLAGPAPGQSQTPKPRPQKLQQPQQQKKSQQQTTPKPQPQPEPKVEPKAAEPKKQKIDPNISSVINKLDNQDKEILQAALQDEKTEREISGQNSDSENKNEPKSATQVGGIVNSIIEFFKKQLEINDLKPEEVVYPERFQRIQDFAKNLSHVILTLNYEGKRTGNLNINIDYDPDNSRSISDFIEEAKLVQQFIKQEKFKWEELKRDEREEYSYSVAGRASTAGWGALGRGWRSAGGFASQMGRMAQRGMRQAERRAHLRKIQTINNLLQELDGINNFLKINELRAKKALNVMKKGKK